MQDDRRNPRTPIRQALGFVKMALPEEREIAVAEGAIFWVKRMASLCAERGLHARVGRGASCSSGGCTPKAQLFVPPREADAARRVLEEAWLQDLQREGTLSKEYVQRMRDAWQRASSEPVCPACGHVGPLVDGACGECGLVLA